MSRLLAGALCVLSPLSVLAEDASGCDGCADADALQIEATYTGEMWRQASGGVARGSRYLDNLDLTASADGGRLFGLPGLQLFAYVLYNNGHALAEELTGATQGVSNIESVDAVRLYELWSQWESGAGAQSIRFGLYDLNTEFDSIETAGLFIHPSHGIGPDFAQTGRNGPSIFPVTSLALRAMRAAGPWSLQAAVLDGVPGDPEHPDRNTIKLSRDEGALLVGQVSYRADAGISVNAGYWRYTAKFDDLSSVDAAGEPRTRDDNAGAYMSVASPMLFKRSEDRGINLFARVGEAEARINPIAHYIGAGAVYTGLFSPRDQAGIAVAVAELGTPFRRAEASAGVATDAREYNYELTYRFEITEWMALQSDAQYVDNPGMDASLHAGWTLGLRVEVSAGWAW
ncbi:MAG: carbohydrate porin [Steroidobacteraceae bacterium]